MDTIDDNHMEGMKMDIENKQTVDNNVSDRLSDEMHRPLAISEGPSSSCTEVRVRTRPKLQWTKSFPPYNQCIGGLGEWDNELNPETSLHHQQHLRQEVMKDDGKEDTERKEDAELNAICARDEVRLKWRARRKERLGGSYDADADRWERGRWSGKRRVEETGGERGREDEEREGSTHSEWIHLTSTNSCFATEIKEKGSEEWKSNTVSVEGGEKEASGEKLEGRDEEAGELSGRRGGSTTHPWASPHPILSKLLQASSTTSSCSSIGLSSAESDEAFSEGEDVVKKRKTLRKVRTAEMNTEWLDAGFWLHFQSWHLLSQYKSLCFSMLGLKLYFSTLLCTCGHRNLHGIE